MKLSISTLTGKTLVIDAEPSDSPLNIKEKIQDLEGIPPDLQVLVYAGRQLSNDFALADYGIYAEASLSLIINLRGC
ncbi:unnamed protein product [Blepharisma stoltei]|uniref:Ubiquitin-like domain-containing protein n=1 Tax=Blepharisma stoltei TaxID=1481888 RepID=A0AAU9IA55_9CILI|nr:unnamed protein product [Blepharisma stoltei]